MRTAAASVMALLVAAGLSACATDKNVVAPATKFATAEASTTASERAYLDQVNASNADARDAKSLFNYLNDPRSIQPSDLAAPPPAIPADTRKGIEQVLSALDLYGKALAGMAGDTSYGDLTGNAKNLSTQLAAIDKTKLANGKIPLDDANVVTSAWRRRPASSRWPILSTS
jgi:hypothetical protein